VSLGAQLDPALWPSYLTSAGRILRRRFRGPRALPGADAAAIARAAVDACWTGEYLAASGGHFVQLWVRDLSYAIPSLVAIGQVDRAVASLAWALEAWSRRGQVTTTIFPGRRPRDVWTLGADSLPLLLRSLQVVGAEGERLVARNAGWLGAEVGRYAAEVVDPATGLVRDDRAFSSHRDTLRTRSNAANNAMVVLLDRVLRETSWFASPFGRMAGGGDPRGRFLARFRLPDGTMIDRPDTAEPTGDAAVLPWQIGALDDPDGLSEALAGARRAGLADPLPLRYATRRDPAVEDPVQRRLVPDYQGTAIWTSLGAMYLRLAGRIGAPDAPAVAEAYRAVLERDRTVIEVYDGRAVSVTGLRPYRGTAGLFIADEPMLWGAILADVLRVRPGG
jgi:hypothetical protein